MAVSSVVNRNYTYSRGGCIGAPEAEDVHDIEVTKRWTNTRVLLACLSAAALALYHLFVSQDSTLGGVFWRLVCSVVFYKIMLGRAVVKESVVVMPTFGIQLETHYSSLSLVLQDESDLMLVFKELRPPLKMLVPIWKALCLASGDPESKEASVEVVRRSQRSSKVV